MNAVAAGRCCASLPSLGVVGVLGVKMKYRVAFAAAGLLCLAGSPSGAESRSSTANSGASALDPAAGEPSPQFGPAPSWAKSEPSPSAGSAEKDAPFHFLLTSSQERLTAKGVENFVEYVVQPSNQAGLQAIGTVVIPWNINRADLTLNAVTIERGGKVIDALRREDVSVIRRETGLEKSTLTGVRTVVMPVRGLQVGDKLRVGFTFNLQSRFGATEEVQDVDYSFPVRRSVRRFLIADDLPVHWAVDPSAKELTGKGIPGFHERLFISDNMVPAKERSFVPARLKTKIIQVSAYKSWQQVADPLIPMFDEARKVADDSAVAALATKIATTHSDVEGRMLAALRTVQDDVRYVALLLGDGDYKPMSAEEVWAGRFGDCKGKTALLLALLDRLGIKAEPMLAAVQYDDGLEHRLPSLAMFDHVYARARIGDATYYLDGTDYGQRTLEELRMGTTVHVLPLVAGTSLVTIPDVMPSKPLQDAALVWDASGGVTDDIPFTATLTLRGPAAADMRAKTATSTDHDKLVETLKSKVPGVSNKALELVSTEPNAADGSYVAKFKGTASIDWRPVDGMKGNRMEFSQTTVSWDGEFDRDDDGDGNNAPVLLAFPYWEHSTESIVLPNGGKDFRVDAEAIDKTVAGTKISRTVTMKDGVVTVTNDFRRLQRELSAADARAAKAELDKISSDYAYVVSRKRLKLPD